MNRMGTIADYLDLAINEAANGDPDFRITLQKPNETLRWLQISWDSMNFSYPSHEDPVVAMTRVGIRPPALVELTDWQPGKYATFEHGADSLEAIASFVEQFVSRVVGIEPGDLVVQG
jgi:hypothetical protein